MADWNKPALQDAYTDWLQGLKDRDLDSAKMFDGVTLTNPVSGMKRWSAANNRWESYNGTAWVVLSTAFALALGAGSTIDAAPIGATTPSTAKFTTLEASGLTKLATGSRVLVAGATDDGASALQVNGTATFATQATADNSTKGATTAFVKAQGYATLASPALTGTPTAPTAAANTNTTQVATTAFVLGQAATATPSALGTAAVGTGTRWAKEDHVHAMPALDSLNNVTITANSAGELLKWTGTAWINNTLAEAGIAPAASPALTGTPTAPTAAVDTNTTQLATTAFVIGQGYAKLASPALTGTPTAPTAAVGTNTTQVATTAFVLSNTPKQVGDQFGGATTSGVVRVLLPDAAELVNASTPGTGAIKLALPVASATYNAMMKLRVEIWDYANGATNGSTTLLISAYKTSAHVWNAQSVQVLAGSAARDFTVRFGNDGTTGCIWIGETTSTWYHLRAWVAEAMITYNSDGGTVARWQTGWAMSLVTTFGTVEDIVSSNLPVAKTAAAWTTARTLSLIGDVTGSASVNGSGDVSITATVGDDSHNHSIAFVTGLQAALDAKAPLASPALTGTPTAPTAAVDTNTTQLATTAFVIGQGYAKLASPALTGTPTAPTATAGTNTTQLATCEFVQSALAGSTSGWQEFTASGNFTVPAGVTAVYLSGCGGGGGGRGAGGSGAYLTGGAGGRGGRSFIRKQVSVTPGAVIAVTIGGGGGGGTNAAAGGAGGTTSFGALLSMPGGAGGSTTSSLTNTYVTGGVLSGAGGDSAFGTGGASVYNAAGNSGAGYGAGGSGGSSPSSTYMNGGSGTAGYLLVEW